jgi:hypothetical protein
MADEAAEPTLSAKTDAPGSSERHAAAVGDESAADPLVSCPSCSAEVVLREASYFANEPSVGLACPNCGAIVSDERRGNLPPGAGRST